MAILVTGAAGFIGFHVATALLARGDTVMGLDNLNDYYDVRLKHARLDQLTPHKNFSLIKADVADVQAIQSMFAQHGQNISGIIHLAAQAGVRYSLINPYAYITSNITGTLTLLEAARHMPTPPRFVYASSSSVYGSNTKTPFSVHDAVDHPVSLYAASKRADELMAETYAHLFKLPLTGLRFFTVYGPWGRPDMAAYLFAAAMMHGEPIKVFNHGHMARDFTYIDDIVAGILAAHDRQTTGHKVYNLGNNHPENLLDFIAMLEEALGVEAKRELLPMQAGDVPATFADITDSEKDLGFAPKTNLRAGIARFVAWFKAYHA
ncbi:MAG: SDR family NAD(P)-dependent oxidoreductase [Alphaproteobacteria bacterium]|nr:SDR family NAD(P)-dependent oxidoreductase [Alphaproteobacteria bacterium]